MYRVTSSSSKRVLASLIMNVISSVAVIIVNKRLVYNEAGFHFVTLLTAIHFVASFFGCLLLSYLGFFQIKRLAIKEVLSISLAFCGYVVFNNLSLLNNTISVYQMSKILGTPLIVWIEYVAYNKRERRETLLALTVTCLGVAITVFVETSLNLVGMICALLAIISNSLYTIWGNTKQKELGASASQLLLYQAPISAAILFFVAPMESLKDLIAYEVTFTTVWTIALSCIFAFGVNLSFFLFVGQTSPLTTNVIGYLKTSLVFVAGFIFVPSEVTLKKIVGVSITLIGLCMYVYYKSKIQPPPPNTGDEEDAC
ncbi:hypothetical protein TRVL_02846 [Trypanosoma vivax]|nr:hypothetical protein TRVL_02846 [Trypanosoma vivax]